MEQSFTTLLKNKQYYVRNLRVNTRIERDISKFQNDSKIIKKQSDLCRSAIKSDTKNPSLFDMIWEIRANKCIAGTAIDIAPSEYIQTSELGY